MLVWFAETTIVAGILAVVAMTVSRFRSIAPSVRHALWVVVLIKFVTPPLVSWPWALDCRSLEWPAAWCQIGNPVIAAEVLPPPTEAIALSDDQVPAGAASNKNDCAAVETDETTLETQLASTEPVENTAEPDQDAASESDEVILPKAEISSVISPWPSWLSSVAFSRALLLVWLVISVVITIGQAIRIVRFRRRLRGAFPAPDFLIDEADRIGRWLGVTVPDLLVVDDLGTPMLWCLGRPQLLLPTRLVKTLPLDRWRGILTHELAHLRRRDQWVSRLELFAGLIWWWNPLYWLARGRLDAEAELACDAWVVWALPKDRLTYAEVLFDICSTLSLAEAFGARVGRRRLGPILRAEIDHDSAQPRPLPPVARWPCWGMPSRSCRVAHLVGSQARFRSGCRLRC